MHQSMMIDEGPTTSRMNEQYAWERVYTRVCVLRFSVTFNVQFCLHSFFGTPYHMI